MKISTEAIVRAVFATEEWEEPAPMQLAICRIRDGVPLGDELRSHPDVIAGVGGADAIEALPSERGIKPSECWLIASARTAKTTIATAGAIADVLSMPLEGLGPGEVPRVSITSVKLDVADVPFRKLRAAFEHPTLAPLLLDARESDRTMTVRHPSGRPVEFRVTAGGKAAGGLAARWSAGLLADEAPRQAGREDDAVTNLADCLSVVRERLLPGAQIMAVGSPWAPSGPAYDAVQTYFGKPTDDVVCLRMTGPAGNPSYWTPERLAKLEAKDLVAWRINSLGEFIDPESGLLNPVAVRENTRRSPLHLNRMDGSVYSAALDPGSNRYTLVICEWPQAKADEPTRYRVAYAREWLGDPEACLKEVATDALHYGVVNVLTDQFAGSVHAALARKFGINLIETPWTPSNRIEQYSNVATLVHSGDLELHPDPTFQRDILAVRRRVSQAGGFAIFLPRTGDGRHCDFAPALVAAVNAVSSAPRPLTREEVRANRESAAVLNRFGVGHWEVDETGQLRHFIQT